MKPFENLTLPFSYSHGSIVDGSGKTILQANREYGTTPLAPYQRDLLVQLACDLLNEAFEYDKADMFLREHGY